MIFFYVFDKMFDYLLTKTFIMSITYSIFLRKNQTNIDGFCLVCLSIIQGKKQKLYSVGVRVLPKNWNIKAKEYKFVKSSDFEHYYKNGIIEYQVFFKLFCLF